MLELILFNQDKFAKFTTVEEVFLECGMKLRIEADKEFISSKDKFVYLLMSGICHQSYICQSGKQISLQFYERGHLLGENILWTKDLEYTTNFSATRIRSLTNCTLYRMTQTSFKFLMRTSKEISDFVVYQNVLKQEANKIYLAMLQLHDLRQRIINLLFYLSCQMALDHDYDSEVSIEVIRKEYAKLLGCSRESMGQKLLHLANDNLIQLNGKNVLVTPSALTQHAIF